MKQHEFIFMAKNMKVENIKQDNDDTIIILKEGILLKHNYKKKDLITIELSEINESYIIPSKKDLEEIYRIYLSNKNFTHLLYEYCRTKLTKT